MLTNSYFDYEISGRKDTENYAKSTSALQTPTAYGTSTSTDIYANWDVDVDNGLDKGVQDGTAAGDATADDPWDFGTDSEYPVLKVDFDLSGTSSEASFGTQLRFVPVKITKISPQPLREGTYVSITGALFSKEASDVTVTFIGTSDGGTDDREATVLSANFSEIKIIVPDEAISGPMQVEVRGQTGTLDVTVLAPSTADNLIDVGTLEQLNAIRYDLDGDGEGR